MAMSETGTLSRRRRSRAEMVHDALRLMIVTQELPPGEPLSERQLSERFQVSRTPLREAMLRLAEHGLVTIAPQHGSFVSAISPRAVRQAHFLRDSVEVAMIRRLAGMPAADLGEARALLLEMEIAAGRGDHAGFIGLDDRFHAALFAAADLAELWDVIHARKGHLDRIRFMQAPRPGKIETLLAEHADLLDSAAQGRAEEAAQRMRRHVSGSLEFMEHLLRERPELFRAGQDSLSPG